MLMKLKGGKSKVLTLSYDDGVVQDIRLIQILDKYGLKGTFNINSGRYLPEDTQRERFYGRMKLSEALAVYKGSHHEVAVHSLNHPRSEPGKRGPRCGYSVPTRPRGGSPCRKRKTTLCCSPPAHPTGAHSCRNGNKSRRLLHYTSG